MCIFLKHLPGPLPEENKIKLYITQPPKSPQKCIGSISSASPAFCPLNWKQREQYTEFLLPCNSTSFIFFQGFLPVDFPKLRPPVASNVIKFPPECSLAFSALPIQTYISCLVILYRMILFRFSPAPGPYGWHFVTRHRLPGVWPRGSGNTVGQKLLATKPSQTPLLRIIAPANFSRAIKETPSVPVSHVSPYASNSIKTSNGPTHKLQTWPHQFGNKGMGMEKTLELNNQTI